jgi:hypothetical protein
MLEACQAVSGPVLREYLKTPAAWRAALPAHLTCAAAICIQHECPKELEQAKQDWEGKVAATHIESSEWEPAAQPW